MLPIRLDSGFAAGLIILLLTGLISGCSPLISAPPASIPAPAPEVTTKEIPPARPFPADTFYDLLVAEVALHQEDYDVALDNYLTQSKRTQDPGVAQRTVQIAEYLKREDSAIEAAQIWMDNDPDNSDAQVVLGTLMAKAQRPEEAFNIMSTLLKQGGKPNFAAVAASAANSNRADQEKLLARFDALIVEFPDNTEPLTGKALLLQQMNQPEAALQQITAVLERTDNDLHAVVIEAQLKKQLQMENPFARLAASVEAHPENRNLRLQYARFLADDKQYEAAKIQLQNLLSQTPYDTDLIFTLAQVNYASGDRDEASKLLEFLIAIDKRTLEASYMLGEMAREKGDLPAAINYYSALPPSPELIKAAGQIGKAYLDKKNLPAVHAFYTSLRKKYPQQAVTFYIAEADLLMNEEYYDEGAELVSNALKEFPDQINLLYTRSLFSEKTGNLVLMEIDLRTILIKEPDNVAALNALGYSLANLTSRYDEAQELIARALALKPDDAAIMDSMGWVEYRRGNLNAALSYLEKAYQLYPDAEVGAHLGEVLWQLNRKAEAKKIWAESQKSNPENSILRNTLQRLTGNPLIE